VLDLNDALLPLGAEDRARAARLKPPAVIVIGEDVLASPRYRGTHGQRPKYADNAAFFLAAGAGVRRGGELGPIVSRDLAPTPAQLLGIRMGSVDGRRLDEALA